jgi:SP family myo-inositol transporter-like MFS transporter 13
MPRILKEPTPIRHDIRSYDRFLLFIAGLGGMLYGIDVGIIGSALPYLEATSQLSAGQLSTVVAAVLLGSVLSTLFAGLLADWMGRRTLMTFSGITFVISIPVIALSHGYGPLLLGRLLQGLSGGFIGVVVPLYLAECLPASSRGRGTGVFQWLLTIGIVSAAIIGIYFSYQVDAVARSAGPATVLLFKDRAWRRIFWVSLPPGVLFTLGSLFVTESPRWLFTSGRIEQAYMALLRSRTPEDAVLEFSQMERAALISQVTLSETVVLEDSLLRRKYVIPFLLACVILFCNTATGISSIIGYNTNILLQVGLSDVTAHWGYVLFTIINVLMTISGVALVDRKGRRYLFILGTAGIILSLAAVGVLFKRTEKLNLDCRKVVQSMVSPTQTLTLLFSPAEARKLIIATGDSGGNVDSKRTSLTVMYSYGAFTATTGAVRSDDRSAASIHITRDSCVPANKVEAFFRNPFANLDAARIAPLKIDGALVSPIPDVRYGEAVAVGLYLFIAFYAIGPGVCVWLALSELMPTRIRSNGMSIALVINQIVSTILAGIFLPVVSRYGYSTMFFVFATFTVFYLITVVFFLPETKDKTLEEIERYFELGGRDARSDRGMNWEL